MPRTSNMEWEDMGETDTPDFNKARGYLIGFSTVVLMLWYFGADLSTFKLLGNEIKLKENVKNVWMVLALINFYLWLRLYQRTPAGSFRFDLPMHDLYEKTLIHVMKYVDREKISDHVIAQIVETPGAAPGEYSLRRFNAKGKMTYHEHAPRQGIDIQDRLARIRDLDSASRNEIRYSFFIHYLVRGDEHHLSGSQTIKVSPSRLVARLVKWYVFMRGALVSPWFFDHVTPFVLGGASICVALLSWWHINFS